MPSIGEEIVEVAQITPQERGRAQSPDPGENFEVITVIPRISERYFEHISTQTSVSV